MTYSLPFGLTTKPVNKYFEGCKTKSDYLGRFLFLITCNGFSNFMDEKLKTKEADGQ